MKLNTTVIHITGMLHPQSGNPVPNQYNLQLENGGRAMQSYQTIVAHMHKGTITLGAGWDCSRTTLRYVASWLGLSNATEIRKEIKAGRIQETDEEITL